MIITADQLETLEACSTQVAIFREEWPDGAEVTLEHCQRAAAIGFDFDWAAQTLLPPLALKAYDEATAPAREAYDKATALAREAYKEATALAREAYKEAKAPAWKAYGEATALAFYTAMAAVENE